MNNTLQVAEQSFKVPAKNTYGWVVQAKNHLMAGGAADYYDDASAYRNKVAWSGIDTQTGLPFPEGWPDENVGTVQNSGEHLRGGTMLGDMFLVFEDTEIWMWVWLDNPDTETGNGNMEPVGAGRGACTFKSIVNVDGDVWVMDRQGIYNYRGGQNIAPVTESIQPEFERINWRQVAQFHGCYDEKRIYWFVALDEEEECHYAFVLDRASLATGKGVRWWLHHFPMGARDSTSYVMGNSSSSGIHGFAGRRVAQIVTIQGHEMLLEEDVFLDGVGPALSKAGTTSGAATQVFEATGGGTFLSGNTTVAGCYVKFDHPDTPEPLLIASVTGSTFTLKTALAANLPVGTPFTIGYIRGLWRSGQLDAGGPEQMKDYDTVDVVINPMPLEGEVRVVTRSGRRGEFVAGRNETNRSGYEIEQYQPGTLLKTGGRIGTTGNREGYSEVPIHGRDGRYIEIEVQDESPLPWEIVGYYVQSKSYPKKK